MKRLWWLGAGYAAGVATAVWVRSKAREAAQRYAPANVRDAMADRSLQAAQKAQQAAADSAKNLGREFRRMADDVRQAVAEGREAMRHAESELTDYGADPATNANANGDANAVHGH